MMFNKILVLTDEYADIRNYEELARYVFSNLSVASDVIFSSGPMDVLDHSCSKMGFGGKMCIDGTRKFDEEKDDSVSYLNEKSDTYIDKKIMEKFGEVKKVNSNLLQKNIPCLILSVEKNRKGHLKSLHQQICSSVSEISSIKMILYVEHTVDPDDLPVALWRFCNNLDPKRDHILIEFPNPKDSNKKSACLGLDGTRKTKELDDFDRDWPNIIVADRKTIESVDSKWDSLQLGAFISSPSLKFQDQMYGEEAVVGL